MGLTGNLIWVVILNEWAWPFVRAVHLSQCLFGFPTGVILSEVWKSFSRQMGIAQLLNRAVSEVWLHL